MFNIQDEKSHEIDGYKLDGWAAYAAGFLKFAAEASSEIGFDMLAKLVLPPGSPEFGQGIVAFTKDMGLFGCVGQGFFTTGLKRGKNAIANAWGKHVNDPARISLTHDPEARVVSPSFSPPVIRDYSLADFTTDAIRTGLIIGGKMVMTGIFTYYMGQNYLLMPHQQELQH